MCDSRRQPRFDESEQGFTLIEVLISILITLIVMASVFALLTRGQRSFQREPEVADLQQSARTVLNMVSRDILQAGAGLPPEFPAFSRVNGAGDNAPTDVLEMIGTFQLAGELYLDPEEVDGFVGNDVRMAANTSNLEIGDMVVVYNDASQNVVPPQTPRWALARVDNVTENAGDPNFQALVTLDYGAYDPQYSHFAGASNPPDDLTFFAEGGPQRPKVTRVSVVRYFTTPDDPAEYSGPPPEVLMRDVDFGGNPQAVGYLEDFEISYIIGITAPVEQDNPPNPAVDLAGVPLTAENMLSGVRVTVTARSVTAGMEGASEGAAGRSDDFIRKTFSTNVNPRNVSAGLDIRVMSALSSGGS